MSETHKQAKEQSGKHELRVQTAENTLLGSVLERILLSQPLNPLKKCEFEVIPRWVGGT